MGWCIQLTADRPIKVEDVDKAVKNLDTYLGTGPWGWSCACDVLLPRDNTVNVGGAWSSEDRARSFSRTLAYELQKCGYKIEVGELRG